MDQKVNKSLSYWLWLLMGLYILASIASFYIPILGLLPFPLIFIFALIHGSRRYGWYGSISFLLICLVISISYENISIATGFPFGFYHWSKIYNPPPWIGTVPLFTGIAYCGTGYISWVIANVLLDNTGEIINKENKRFVTPLIAAFIMVMWDLGMDPMSSTVQQVWVWHYGGGYFGVPYTNFLGWYLVVWTIYQVYALFLSYRKTALTPIYGKGYYFQAVIFYLLIAISNLIPVDLHNIKKVTDLGGKTWSVGDIYETTLIVTIFSMGFVIVLALIKLASAKHAEV
jgi:uncharacterized membrane protein